MICELDRGLGRPARVRLSRRGRHVGRQPRVGASRGKCTVPCSELFVAHYRCDPAMQITTLCRVRPVDDGGGQKWMRGAHVISGDDEDAARDCDVERLDVGERGELAHAQVRTQRDSQQQPARALREPVDPEPEEILDGIGHGEDLADPGHTLVDELASDLEREEGVAEGGVVDPPQELS